MGLPLLAAGAAVLGGVASIFGARERGRALMQEGKDLRIQADIEELNAQINESDLRDQLVRTLASNTAAAAASGVSGPSVAAATLDDNAVAGRAIKIRNLESLFKTHALRRQAKNLQKQGKSTIIAGTLGGLASIGMGAASFGAGGGGGAGLTGGNAGVATGRGAVVAA